MLPPLSAGSGRNDMLVKQEHTTRLQDAPDFPDYGIGVMDHAKHQRRYDRIKAGVRKWQALPDLLHNGCLPSLAKNMSSQTPCHVEVGLDESNCRFRWVERQIRSSAATHFQNIPSCKTCSPPAKRHYTALNPGIQQIVTGSKEALAQAHYTDAIALIVAAARSNVPDGFDLSVSNADELVPAVHHDVLLAGYELELVP